MATAAAATAAPARSSPVLPGRDDQPTAAMTGPSIGPRPAAIPTTIPSTNISLANPSAIAQSGGTSSGGGITDVTIPAPAALTHLGKQADKLKHLQQAQKTSQPLALKHPSAVPSSEPTTRAHPVPGNPFDESVYKLIPEVVPAAEREKRYRSKFAQQAREEYRSGMKPFASMGVPHVEVLGKKGGPGEGEFLKKREREVGVVDAPHYHPDRTIRKAPVPKEPGKIPSPPQRNFIKQNALDNINT
ncbi:hypothetical protein HK097_002182, partial [Rhizophlyctis rosea]